jgi:hypothetical protein
MQRAQDGAAEVVHRSGAGGLAAADQVLLRPLPLVWRQAPVLNPIVETNRSFDCLRFKIRSSIEPAAYNGLVV